MGMTAAWRKAMRLGLADGSCGPDARADRHVPHIKARSRRIFVGVIDRDVLMIPMTEAGTKLFPGRISSESSQAPLFHPHAKAGRGCP
jgi:hypothetical protein